MFKKLSSQKFDPEVLYALRWKKPDEIEVVIKKANDGYFAKIVSFKDDNVITQASTGQELIEMVNEAMYDFLDIPEVYRGYLGYFMPDVDVRHEMQASIPQKYLNKEIGLVSRG